ncbi:fumarate reductase flavoprotein subunit [Anaerosolibacter carboniphilus]|uniref:Fumarate reductase flavoprotein subunit n=1 Tax=Anaerosolibacter carboniphilus TaxID=1417629 RepID=A0A841KVZ5_9FIRM|nr:FMN-binding protein [Anaerosolibacter carboniphilus]MBB6216190.1 fumarate reductase flavoprotein subunit [Anaerosolibacter carboniphilus]
MLKKRIAIILVLILAVALGVGCQSSANAGKYVDGTYTGVGEGKGGPIKVEVVVEKGNIKEVKTIEHSETPGLSDPVFEKIIKSIIEKQTPEVDVVSGGTVTSKGIMAAVTDAVKDAAK